MTLERLGPRVCILGSSCSGKSTLAQKMGAEMNAPVIHLDQLAHEPGTNWKRRPDDELIKAHDEAILGERWVIEGNYGVCLPQRLQRATSVIYLDKPIWLCLWRYLRRSLRKRGTRPGGLQGTRDAFNWEMPWYILTYHPQQRAGYFETIAANPHLYVEIRR